MKHLIRILIFSLLISILIPAFPARAQNESGNKPVWLPANSELKPASPAQTEVELIDERTLEVTITFPGVWAQVQTGDGQAFTQLWHEDYGSYRQPGQPALPGTTFNLLVPEGAQVQVVQQIAASHVVNLTKQNLPKMILPAQEQGTKSEPPPPWTPPDPLSYASRSAIPQSWYEVKETFQMRDYTILPLWINPVRYRAVSGEIELLEKIELRLTWPKLSADIFSAKPKSDSPSFDRLVSQIVINPPELPANETNGATGEGYLIITPDAFYEEIQEFAIFKQKQGYVVTVATLTNTGSTSSQIQAFIQAAYKTWSPRPSFLLLVGDTNLIPGIPGTAYEFNMVTDLYYGTMDSDFKPEIAVGRFPIRSKTDLNNLLDKIFLYDNGYHYWNSQVSFIASCDHYYVTEKSHNDVIDNWTAKLGYPTFFPLVDPLPGGDQLYCYTNSARKPDILNSINNGRGIITYSGHGTSMAWLEPYPNYYSILATDLYSLTNYDSFSFVASFACSTNDFGNESYPSVFGETWMLLEKKGAIAFLGSADESLWGQDDELERALYDSLFLTPLNPPSLRIAITEALSKVNYPIDGKGQEQYYWETYNLLGDPSQKLWLVPGYEFEAETKTLAQDGLITNLVKYPIIITNLGNTDSYSAVILGNKWLTDTNVVTYLPYHSSETLWVTVHIPENALPGESDKVDVTISSQNSDQTETFSFTTTALETFFTRFPLIFK